ncbi:MAG: glycerophosphodiester phosphodiesterase [Acidobacteriia bacterium]|nr:glycerophosphodiester phosphodiesterase [Terriglobia bacterium]
MADKLLLLGHRGARRYAAENTLAAFDLALDHGAHGFEFDVRRTRDLHTVLVHDPKLHGLVLRRHTLEQVEDRCRHLHHLPPPSLEDVLDRYSRTAFLNIEVKVRGIEELVVRAVRRTRPHHYFISSFLPSVVKRLHRLDRNLVLGALAQTGWQLRRWKVLPAQYVVPHYRLLTPRLMEKLHDAGRKVVTWTVNDPRHMRRAAELGVDGIISDDTKLLVATLG